MKLGVLTSKLESGKILKSQIEEISQKESIMTDEQITEEEMRTKKTLEDPLKIIDSIEDLEDDSAYLPPEQIQILKSNIKSAKLSLGKPDEPESELECIICLAVPKSQSGGVVIYSCDIDHLLCRDCIPRVNSCPSNVTNFCLM